ncbi:MAG: tetratricopeptide repeat protein [Anaerolineales bacterium]|nr:tetratricopeptide repeat protein [Anaerolineales bacterium]
MTIETLEPAQLNEMGKKAFERKNFDEAADYFRRAVEGYTLGRAGLLAAEVRNNLSVTLLQAGKPQEALNAALETDQLFASAKDIKRQAMALGNQAAALEGLGRNEEALEKYEQSADLFGQINDGDMRALVMKSAAAIKLKTGKITESAFKMMGSVDVKENPTLFERIMKFLLRFIK